MPSTTKSPEQSPAFQRAADWLVGTADKLGIEGGFSNNPADKGGRTKYGVSEVFDSVYLDELGIADIMDLTQDQAKQVFYSKYWRAVKGDKLPPTVAMSLFDFAVHSGQSTAIKKLQRLVGVKPDGIVGPKTIAAVEAGDSKDITDRLMGSRRAYLKAIVRNNPDQGVFETGWENRVGSLEHEIEGLALRMEESSELPERPEEGPPVKKAQLVKEVLPLGGQ